MRVLFVFVTLFCTLLLAKPLVFGVVPQQSPLVLIKKWTPLINELSKKSGVDIVLKIESSIPKFQQELYAGKYDIAYMNPYHFVIANKKQNYQALARSSKDIQGIVVSKDKRAIKEIKSIADMRFLFPAPMAFAATLLTKYELNKKYNLDIENYAQVSYVNSHDSVYKGVARGIGEYGGGIVRTYDNLVDKESKKSLHIVYTTDKYPSHPIAIKPNISKEISTKLTNALLDISQDSISRLSIPKIIKIDSSEYDIVKDLAIKLDIY